jgi:hypothetical protein
VGLTDSPLTTGEVLQTDRSSLPADAAAKAHDETGAWREDDRHSRQHWHDYCRRPAAEDFPGSYGTGSQGSNEKATCGRSWSLQNNGDIIRIYTYAKKIFGA